MTTPATTYLQCGLRVRSEVELHLPVATDPDGDADLVVSWGADVVGTEAPPPGDVIATYGPGAHNWYTVTATGDGYLARFRNCGDFVISAGLDRVEIRRDMAGRHELLPILMAGTVSAMLLNLRGETVLHASAVAFDGAAIAFVGQSGRGKSTLATLMCLAGAELVTDDVLAVRPGLPVTCVGGAAELRLRAAAASLADGRAGGSVRATADDRVAFAPSPARTGPMPLRAIVAPAPSRDIAEVEVRQLTPSEALVLLLAFPRVHGWSRPDVLTRDLANLSQLANSVPMYAAKVPWGPPFDPGIATSLAALAR